MQLTSQAFKHNEYISVKYTCQGQDLSPPLAFVSVPAEAKSLALSCLDPDAPGKTFVHWLIVNMPADTEGLEENATVPGQEIENDFELKSYGGPCPPSGVHRYVFTLYALDVEKLDVTKETFLEQVEAHTITKAELIGLYEKS